MDIETIKQILETRKAIAEEQGNSTECSLLYALLSLSNELKERREKDKKESE